MLPTTFRPDAILECLLDNEVRFIVIGGLAAFAQGAGWPTQDADIVVDCAEGNLRRLLIALSEAGSRVRHTAPPAYPAQLEVALGLDRSAAVSNEVWAPRCSQGAGRRDVWEPLRGRRGGRVARLDRQMRKYRCAASHEAVRQPAKGPCRNRCPAEAAGSAGRRLREVSRTGLTRRSPSRRATATRGPLRATRGPSRAFGRTRSQVGFRAAR